MVQALPSWALVQASLRHVRQPPPSATTKAAIFRSTCRGHWKCLGLESKRVQHEAGFSVQLVSVASCRLMP